MDIQFGLAIPYKAGCPNIVGHHQAISAAKRDYHKEDGQSDPDRGPNEVEGHLQEIDYYPFEFLHGEIPLSCEYILNKRARSNGIIGKTSLTFSLE